MSFEQRLSGSKDGICSFCADMKLAEHACFEGDVGPYGP
jgi:hypothetical protein